MTLVLPKSIFFQALHAARPHTSSSSCIRPLSSRFVLKVHNSSASFQPSDDTPEDQEDYSQACHLQENTEGEVRQRGVPLKAVVADCEERWFKECLKIAEDGDIDAQATVSQMYYTGYGVPRDLIKATVWLRRVRSKKKPPKSSNGAADNMKSDDTFFFI